MHRRRFISQVASGVSLAGLSSVALSSPLQGGVAPVTASAFPKLTFYGSTQQVSGSCHLLETSRGLVVVDCGLFYGDIDDHEQENQELPFDPRDVKAFFLTHAHVDHNGRLPMLVDRGLKCPIYCTDATRDISRVMMNMSASFEAEEENPLFDERAVTATAKLMKIVPYNKIVEGEFAQFRYTDAGHILGSAMVEMWVDDRKILFGGDMGPDTAPILCRPTQHFGADAVLVESTYGPVPRANIDYEEFGRRIAKVINRGGSVLIPSFAVHKTQTLIYVLHRLISDGILSADVPIFSDSSTAQRVTRIYDAYREYYEPEARRFQDSIFYQGRYHEGRGVDVLSTHGHGPAIYISTSGMLDHAQAPKHLYHMAADPKNAVFVVGYQAPGSVGSKLLLAPEEMEVPWEERGADGFETEMRTTKVKLEVDRVSGFSSHAKGEQILEWLSKFEELGRVFVVHGDKEQSTGMAAKASEMGLNAVAPKRNDSFVIESERVRPGEVPQLNRRRNDGFNEVDK